MKLTEKLDFSFSFKDYNIITELVDYYLDDRVYVFNKLINDREYSEEEKLQYIHYFITPCLENEKQHEYLEKIKHFITREYEIYNYPKINTIINTLSSLFFVSKEDYDLIDDFENYEVETIDLIYKSWQQLYELISQHPLLDLDSYNYEIIDFVPIYYKDASEFVLNETKKFIDNIKEEFPTSLRRLDSFILCSKDYIEFVAGEGTMAYFVSDNVFLPENVEEKDDLFFITALYHEFGHFIYSLLPEECQILWQDYYLEWTKNNIKLTRDKDNEVEELFADVFSLLFNPNPPDFIHEPSRIIIQVFKEIINRGFTI